MNPEEIPIRDLHLPDAVGWWPLAPGWWAVIALATIGLLWLLRVYLAHRRRGAARRFALRQLEALSSAYAKDGNAVALGSAVSELLRRTMLAYAPRADVAGLTGEEWLEWLDRDLDRSHFVEGDGRPVIEWPYRSVDTEIDRSDVAAFIDAIRLRIETPVGGAA